MSITKMISAQHYMKQKKLQGVHWMVFKWDGYDCQGHNNLVHLGNECTISWAHRTKGLNIPRISKTS